MDDDDAFSEWSKSRLKKKNKNRTSSGKKKKKKKKRRGRGNEVEETVNERQRTGIVPSRTPEKKRTRKRVVKKFDAIAKSIDEWDAIGQTIDKVMSSLQNILERVGPVEEAFEDDVRGVHLSRLGSGVRDRLVAKLLQNAETQMRNLRQLLQQLNAVRDEMFICVEDVAEIVDASERPWDEITYEEPIRGLDLVQWSEDIATMYTAEYWRLVRIVDGIRLDRDVTNARRAISRTSCVDSAWIGGAFAKVFSLL